jgi:cell division protein FtsI/penicillin-binding protein 2
MGNINDINALAYSSNVYQFKTAIKVAGASYRYNQSLKINEKAFDTYRDYFGRFGLGVNTGIELPNESRGYKGSNREPGLLLNFSIGQYDTYTNIQLNQYISTIAQSGKRYKMHLLSEIRDQSGNISLKIEPEVLNELNILEKYINRVKQGLKAVTSYGTGKSYVAIDSAGKTGTSESFYDSDGDGKIDKETISTNFVMYAPSNNPKVAISINSPNIGLPTGYRYPINKNVIKSITKNIYRYIK